nr:MAG TPA: Protein of unknown function (DUF1642) [Caudoviricetes sp.]
MSKKELTKKLMNRMQKFGYFPTFTNVKTFIKEYEKLAKPEPQKPVVQQFVADWYEEHKDDLEYNIWEWFVHGNKKGFIGYKKKFLTWLNSARGNPIQTLVNMHQLGYEVEEEKRYLVKVKNVLKRQGALNRNKKSGRFIFSNPEENSLYDTKFTRKELEEAGFGWIFSCEGIEVEEVE